MLSFYCSALPEFSADVVLLDSVVVVSSDELFTSSTVVLDDC